MEIMNGETVWTVNDRNAIPITANYGLLLPQVSFWSQLFCISIIMCWVGIGFAVLCYFVVIPKRSSVTGVLLGYGILLPIMLHTPIWIANTLELTNTILITMPSGFIVLFLFRCLAVLHNTAPPQVESNFTTFCWYFALPVEFLHYEQSSSSTPPCKNLNKTLWNIAWSFIMTCCWLSLLETTTVPYTLFTTTTSGIWRYLHWKHLVNNASIIYLHSILFLNGTSLVTVTVRLLSGNSVVDITNNPLWTSTSPSDFWNHKWNTLFHGIFKRGVYRPLRNAHVTPFVALMGTFAVSGMVHEYIWYIIDQSPKEFNSRPHYGPTILFFLYNALLIGLEYQFLVPRLTYWNTIPTVWKSMAVIFCVVPVSHWFTNNAIQFGLYSDYKFGFVLIVPLNDYL